MVGLSYKPYVPTGAPIRRRIHRNGRSIEPHDTRYYNPELNLQGTIVLKECPEIGEEVPIIVDYKDVDILGPARKYCDFSSDGDMEIRKKCATCELKKPYIDYLWEQNFKPKNGRPLLPYIHHE